MATTQIQRIGSIAGPAFIGAILPIFGLKAALPSAYSRS